MTAVSILLLRTFFWKIFAELAVSIGPTAKSLLAKLILS